MSNRISGIEGNDEETDRVIGGGDRDNKDCVFENGSDDRAGVEYDTLNFDDRVAGEVTGT